MVAVADEVGLVLNDSKEFRRLLDTFQRFLRLPPCFDDSIYRILYLLVFWPRNGCDVMLCVANQSWELRYERRMHVFPVGVELLFCDAGLLTKNEEKLNHGF